MAGNQDVLDQRWVADEDAPWAKPTGRGRRTRARTA